MEFERGGNEEQAGAVCRDGVAREIAVGGELVAFGVPGDAHPIVEGLEGEVDILGGLDFQDDEASRAFDREQVGDTAVEAGEGGNLAVDGFRAEAGVEGGDGFANAHFEPGFRPALVQDAAVFAAEVDEFGDEGAQFGEVIGMEDALIIDAAAEFAVAPAGEFEAEDAETGGAAGEGNAFDVGPGGELGNPVRQGEDGVLAALEAGLEVAAIGGVERNRVAVGRVGEEGEERFGGVEPAETQGDGLRLVGGQEEGEAFDGDLGLATATDVVQPDEPEGEGVGGFGGRKDGGPGAFALADDGAGIVGGEGVLEVAFGGEIVEFPADEPAAKHQAELFTDDHAVALAVPLEGFGAVGVKDPGFGLSATEFLDDESEAAGLMVGDGEDATVPVADVVPGGEHEAAGAEAVLVAVGEEGEGFVAGFLDDGLLAPVDEGSDGYFEVFTVNRGDRAAGLGHRNIRWVRPHKISDNAGL